MYQKCSIQYSTISFVNIILVLVDNSRNWFQLTIAVVKGLNNVIDYSNGSSSNMSPSVIASDWMNASDSYQLLPIVRYSLSYIAYGNISTVACPNDSNWLIGNQRRHHITAAAVVLLMTISVSEKCSSRSERCFHWTWIFVKCRTRPVFWRVLRMTSSARWRLRRFPSTQKGAHAICHDHFALINFCCCNAVGRRC